MVAQTKLPLTIRMGLLLGFKRGGREIGDGRVRTHFGAAVEADAHGVEQLVLTVVEVVALVVLVLARHVVRVLAALVLLVGTRAFAVVTQRDADITVIFGNFFEEVVQLVLVGKQQLCSKGRSR